MPSPVIFQCNACRALGSAADVVVAGDGTRAGLVCGLCRFTSWLPVSGHVDAGAPSWSQDVVVAPPTGLPPPSTTPPPVSPSLALVPTSSSSSSLASSPFPSEALEKIHKKLATQPEPNDAQVALQERFSKLLTSTWGSEPEHKQLLKAAAMAGELAFVGGRYRAVLDVVRDEPRARAAQQELLTLAMATMQQSKDLGSVGGGEEKSGGGKLIAAVLIVGVILLGGAFFVKMLVGTFAKMEQVER